MDQRRVAANARFARLRLLTDRFSQQQHEVTMIRSTLKARLQLYLRTLGAKKTAGQVREARLAWLAGHRSGMLHAKRKLAAK